MTIHDTEQPLTLVEVTADIDHAYRQLRMYATRASNQSNPEAVERDSRTAGAWRQNMDAAIQLYAHLQERERLQSTGANEEDAEQVG